MSVVEELFDAVDERIVAWLNRYGVLLLRVAVGLIYVWFGALKFVPGASPAEGLIRNSLPFLPMDLFIPFLAFWEVLVGLGFIIGRYLRVIILLMLLQIVGAASPVLLNPTAVFRRFPFILTLEGQYIFKNLVLVAAALVVGATVRGRRLDRHDGLGN